MNKKQMFAAGAAVLLVGAGVGAVLHDLSDDSEKQLPLAVQELSQIQIEKQMLQEKVAELEAREPEVVVETVTETVEVPVESGELKERVAELEAREEFLIKLLERESGEAFDEAELILEDYAAEMAVDYFERNLERLMDKEGLLTLDEDVEIIDMYDFDMWVNDDARRRINGQWQDVMVSEVSFIARVRVTDEDGNSERIELEVEYSQDWQSDGDIDEDISISEL